MNTAYGIIDRWMNQSRRCNCSFARACHLPVRLIPQCESFHPQQQSVRTSSAPKPTWNCSPIRGPVSGATEMRNRPRN